MSKKKPKVPHEESPDKAAMAKLLEQFRKMQSNRPAEELLEELTREIKALDHGPWDNDNPRQPECH